MAGGEGTVFGKYFLLKKIASGGMGEIFLAKLKGPVGFEKLLVVKRILLHHLENQDYVDMFFAEARVAAQLTHANIVQIYEMGEIDDCYYIAMEYVHGKPLRDLIDRTRLRGEHVHPWHAIEIIARVCEGMAYAHNATNLSGDQIGIVHRDLNPHNLLVSYSGEVKIIDFGIAKSHLSANKTESGTIKGKFAYMSPEQSAALPLDKRSDVFALGICLYETLNFHNPFQKQNVATSLDAIQHLSVPLFAENRPELSAFDPVIQRALAKDRAQRFSDCLEFRDALRDLQRHGDVADPKVSLSEVMHSLFSDTIEAEKRMIVATDSATTEQIKLMQAGLEREHASGTHGGYRVKVAGQNARQSTQTPARPQPHVSAIVAPEPPPHSHALFVTLLAAILLVSVTAAAAVFRTVERNRRVLLASHSLTAVTPPPAPVNPQPVVGIATPRPTPEVPPATSVDPVVPEPPAAEANAPLAPEAAESRDARLTDDGRAAPRRPLKDPKEQRDPKEPKEPGDVKMSSKASAGDTGLGVLQISTTPPLRVLLNGSAAGNALRLKQSTGKLLLGTGRDPSADPFAVKVRYKIDGDQITYTIDSEPWSIVRGNGGMGLGKTPLAPQPSTGSSTFELINPQEKRSLKLTLRFAR